MEKFSTGLLKFLAAICAILFIGATPVALLAFNAERRLFDSNLYLAAIEEQNLYAKIPSLAAEALSSPWLFDRCQENPVACGQASRPAAARACFENAIGAQAYQSLARNERAPTQSELDRLQPCFDRFGRPASDSENGRPAFLVSLSAEDWEQLIRAALPPEMARSLVQDSIISIFDYLDGKTASATLSLAELKAHLGGPAGAQAAIQLLRAQPPCTLEDLARIALGNMGGEDLVLCSPSDELLILMEPLIRTQLAAAAAGIPDTVTLIPASAENTQDPLTALRVVRASLRFSPLLPLGILFLVTVFAVRSLKGWCYWWGVPLALGGLFGLGMSAAAHPIFAWTFKFYIAPRFPPALPVSIVELTRGLMDSVLAGVSKPILVQSGLLLLVGILFIILAQIRLPRKAVS